MPIILPVKIFFCIAFILLSGYELKAQPGALDPSFGINGKAYFNNLHIQARSVTMQSDGKVLVGGSHSSSEIQDMGISVTRFAQDGSRDLNFGDKGEVIVRTIGASRGVYVQALSQQQDGKIIVCARFITEAGDVAVLRLLENGSLDSSFGENGATIISIGIEDIIGGMALQPDGKIVVAGQKGALSSSQAGDFVLCLTSNGRRDHTFGKNGLVITTYISSSTVGAVAIQPDGKILTSGIYGVLTKQFQVTRYNTNGSVDSTFGVNGFARLIPATPDRYALKINAMNLQPDGKILVAGSAENYRMSVGRFTGSGEPDLSFVAKGYTVLPMETGSAEARNVFFRGGKIILTGRYSVAAGKSIAAVAYNHDGTLDSSFGIDGVATSGVDTIRNGTTNESGAGAIQSDGKIIIAGSFFEHGFYNLSLFRFDGYTEEKHLRIKKWLHHHGITWDDVPQNDIKYYSIQKSNDGKSFKEISKIIKPYYQHQYNYTDLDFLSNDSYYRVAALTVKGEMIYSNIVQLPLEKNKLTIYPNPVRDNIIITGLSTNQKTILVITGINGVPIMTAQTISSSFNWNVSKLKRGYYILKTQNADETITRKFLKE